MSGIPTWQEQKEADNDFPATDSEYRDDEIQALRARCAELVSDRAAFEDWAASELEAPISWQQRGTYEFAWRIWQAALQPQAAKPSNALKVVARLLRIHEGRTPEDALALAAAMLDIEQAAAEQVKRPINCGTGHCSCIECVMEPVAWKTYIVAGCIKFQIGNQSFRLDFHPNDEEWMTKQEHLEWMRSMLDHALGQLATPPAHTEAMRLALDALRLPCDRWNKQQTEIVNAAIAALEKVTKWNQMLK